ncbi:hypothetical protein D9758_014175 [Tetrapyrgos nigripes]|uniref:Uncharacterized protein n=1 Tax=Tetrapyrgos nigripes TaxID=182062 RepID=A0A8H5CKC6_9AGAR|nr:hypothetical protein D9758_014175 [Tetrapyrgos nigripes]
MRDFLAALRSNEGRITAPSILLLQESDLADIARNLCMAIMRYYRYRRGKDVGSGTALWVADQWYTLIMSIAESETLYDDFPTAVLYLQETLHDWESMPERWNVLVTTIRQPVWLRYHQRILSQCAHYAKILPAGINSYLSVWVHDNRRGSHSQSSGPHSSSSSFHGGHSSSSLQKLLCWLCGLNHYYKEHKTRPSDFVKKSGNAYKDSQQRITSTSVVVADLMNTTPKTIPPPVPAPDMTLPPRKHNLFPVITRLHHEVWSRLLVATGGYEKFRKVLEGLRDGFFIGVENYTLSHTFMPNNHHSATVHSQIMADKFHEEIAKGHISIGFEPSYLESIIGPFCTSPLAVIEQKPGKFRIIINHSYPFTPLHLQRSLSSLTSLRDDLHDNTRIPPPITIDPEIYSVNSLIDTNKFQCAWGTFSECWLLVANAPPGTQASVFDVDAAFRNIPIHLSTRNFVALMFDGLIYLDQCLNFGKASSPGIWGHVADAMVHILLHTGVEALIKNNAYDYSYDESLIWSIAENLSWPWAPLKFVAFTFFFLYIGFHWDIEKKTIELPKAKKIKYSAKISTFLSNSAHTKEEAESVVGTLQHVTLVAPQGRSYLASIHHFVSGFKEDTQAFVLTEFTVWANDMGLHPDEVLPAPKQSFASLQHPSWDTWPATFYDAPSLASTWQSPSTSHRPEHPPVTCDMMRSCHVAWSTSARGDHKCASAAAKCSLLGQLRLSEIFPCHSDPRLFDPSKHPRVQDVVELPPTPESKHGPLSIYLPSTKTSVSRGDYTHIHAYHGSLNATKATHLHVCANDLGPSDPLMSFRDDSGKLKCLTKSHFLSLCNDVWSKEGYPRFTGHSFHIGGTTLLLHDGVNPEYVKMCGRWNSSAFTRYWRDLHTCASIHIDRVHARRCLHQRLNI